MPKMDLYYLANHLGVDFNLINIDVVKGEQYQPAFLKINPQHMVPTLVDGDLVLWESRAIIQYLVYKFDAEGKIYPNNPKERAKVNQLLYFDMGTMYHRFVYYCIFFAIGQEDSLDPVKKAQLEEGFALLETLLKDRSFAAGDHLTIADHCLAVSVSTIKLIELIDTEKYKNVNKWLSRCEREIPDYSKLSDEPLNLFGTSFKARLAARIEAITMLCLVYYFVLAISSRFKKEISASKVS